MQSHLHKAGSKLYNFSRQKQHTFKMEKQATPNAFSKLPGRGEMLPFGKYTLLQVVLGGEAP